MRGRFLYWIERGSYPERGPIMPWGRFYSWEHADRFLVKKLGWRAEIRHQMFTIMCENGCPF